MSLEPNKPADTPAIPADARVKSIARNAAGQLEIRVDGRDEPIVDARIARCFPWTLPDSYVSLRTHEGKELVLLKTLDGLDADSRQVVLAELRDKVFNPQILRVLDHRDEFGVTSIHVQTDRGEATFQVRSRDDVRMLSPTRAVFRDADGNNFEVADIQALDPTTRRFLDEYF